MTGFLIGGLILSVFGFYLLQYSDRNLLKKYSGIAFLTGLLGSIFGVLSLASYCVMVWEWTAAEYKQVIIEREYGVKYTQAEIYYAEDVVDTIQKLHRKRIELTVNSGEK